MATIEEIHSDEEVQQTTDKVDIQDGSDDEVPELEAGDKPTGGFGANIQKPQGRQERKARQSIKKLGLVPVTGVTRVAIRKTKSMLFVINKPDVFKNPNSDTYVVFGEAKVEDPAGQMQQRTASQLEQLAAANEAAQSVASKAKAEAIVEDPISEGEDEDDDDETGVDPKDIDLVMAQASVSRKKAVRGLKKNDGDIVNTIMELSI